MVTVTGKAEVKAYIGGIPAKLQRVLQGAAKAGAAVISDEIKARTPSDDVRAGLRTTSKTEDGQIKVRIDLKPGWGRSVGIWLEYGTSPHFISVDDSQRRGLGIGRVNKSVKENEGNGSLVIGGNFVGQTVFHPGARPFPTFRPALDTKEEEAIAAAQNYVNARIARPGRPVAVGAE
jgi:hypothetical protein